MAILAAVNFVDRLVLLEDGRELPITQFYASSGPNLLRATDELRAEDRVDDHEIAEVFTVEVPGSGGAALIFEMGAISSIAPSDNPKSYN